VIEHQADIEKKTLEGRIGQLKHEIHAFERTSMEKSAQSEAFKSQISSLISSSKDKNPSVRAFLANRTKIATMSWV